MKRGAHGCRAVAASAITLAAVVLLVSCQKSARPGGATGPKATAAQEGRIAFVELGSDSCTPCKAMQPILERVRQEFPQQVEVVFHDVWTPQGKPFASSFRIRVIPTQVFLDAEGREYFRHEGFLPYEEVLAALERGGLAR